MGDIYFWRQMLILITALLYSASNGFMLAFPSALTPAITSPNSTDIKTTADHASWITAMNGIGGVAGCFMMPPVMTILGRKCCYITLKIFSLIGWMIFYFAANVTTLYAARFIQGMSIGGIYLSNIIVSEYVHPCRRGYFLTLKKLVIASVVLSCHALSSYLSWRLIAIIGAVFSALSLFCALFWPESPLHYALKGKFKECEMSFKWLNGNSAESNRQLKSLVEGQRKRIARNNKTRNTFVALMKQFLQKNFQKPLLISTVLSLSLDVCGRSYYMAYLIQIMTEVTDNKKLALYFSLGSDILAILAAATSTVVIAYVKRRTILFSTGVFSVLSMLLISILLYLKSIYTFPTYVLWLIALLILLQSFIINIGVIPVAVALVSEIFPLEHKGLGSFVSCFVFTAFYAAVLKLTPVFMVHTKLYGTYAIYGTVLALCMIILYKTVPETKDKTLQEIEDELSNVPSKEFKVLEAEKLMN